MNERYFVRVQVVTRLVAVCFTVQLSSAAATRFEAR